jgi:predicted RecA/RadA family phage recombinase
MALNRVREEADQVALPVDPATVSGDPVAVGRLNGVALNDYGSWTPGQATVALEGSFRFTLTGPGGGLAVGAIVTRDMVNARGDAAGASTFGHLLEPLGDGVTADVEVRISNPDTA